MNRVEAPPLLGCSLSEHPLTEGDLFESPRSFVLTQLGRITQRLCSIEHHLCALSGQDPSTNGRPTPARLEELTRELEEGCAELGIRRGELPLVRAQMLTVFNAREQSLKEAYPLDRV